MSEHSTWSTARTTRRSAEACLGTGMRKNQYPVDEQRERPG